MRDRLLYILADLICRRPRTIVAVGAVSAIVCALYAATSLRLNANLDDLIAPNRPFMADYRRFLDEFGDLEQIIIAVDATNDRDAAERVVDALLPRLRAIPDLEAVHGSIEPEEQLRIATRAMSDAELQGLAIAADALPALLAGDAGVVLHQADTALAKLIAGGATMAEDEQQRQLAGAVFLLDAIASSGNPKSQIRDLTFPHREYLESDTGRLLFINIQPHKDYATLEVIAEPIARIGEAIDQTRREFPGVELGLTGKPVMQFDEVATSNRDMLRASIIALTLCSVLFMAMMGGIRRPMLAIIAFGMAAAWTYGFATLAVGQLNLLSLVFMLVLVGVGLDYGIHVINRYQEFLAKGENAIDAIRHAVIVAVRGNITGALTSSIVFFMAMFTTFQGLSELGIIAGGGLVLCLIAMSVVLPALLVLVDRPARAARGEADEACTRGKKGWNDAWFIRHARTVIALTVLITIASAVFAMRGGGTGVRFDDNLLNLQARGLESIEWEHRILNDSAAASWFAVVIAPDQESVQAIIDRAKTMPSIGAIRSVFDVIQPDSPQRDAWRAALHAHSPGLARGNAPSDLAAQFEQATARLQLIAQAASARAPDEAKHLFQLIDELTAIDMNDAGTRQAIDASLATTAKSLNAMLQGDRLPLREALPDAVREQFVSRAGSYLVMLHPKHDVWDPDAMAKFISDLRAVNPHVTGVPITHFESLGEMRSAFITMSLLAFAAIVILLAIDFRSVRDVLLAISPLIIGAVWTLGAMRLLGVSFNLANFFAAPMLIGLSVDSAVHMLHRYHEGGDRFDRLNFGRTRRAVILTALTTIIGFGALIIAQHRGLQSLGIVMAIGSTACMIASIVVLPALLTWRGTAIDPPSPPTPVGGTD